MDPGAAEAALRAMHFGAGPEALKGFLSSNPSNELLSEAMGKFTNIQSRVLLAKAGAPLLPALQKILTNNSCDFGHMERLIEAAPAPPTDYELRICMGWAAWKGNLSAVQFLIGKGAPVAGESNFTSVEYQRFHYPSLFACAILSENREVVALFLQLDPAVFNETYGRNSDHHDAALLAKKKMMDLNNPEASFAALSEKSKAALLSGFLDRKEKLELVKSTSGSRTDRSEATFLSMTAASISGFISFVMYMSGGDAMKKAGVVFLGVAVLCVLVGVVRAVSIDMHNRKCDQLNNQKEEVNNRIAELKDQEVSQPSPPPPLVTPSHNNGQQSGNNGQPPAYTPPPSPSDQGEPATGLLGALR
jgi:hypothetical protein